MHTLLLKITTEQLALFIGFAVPVIVLMIGPHKDRRDRIRTEKLPQAEKLLRPPGHSLAVQLENQAENFLTQMVFACAACGIAGVLILFCVKAWILGLRGAWMGVATTLAAAAFALGIQRIRRLFQSLETGRRLRLGMRGIWPAF